MEIADRRKHLLKALRAFRSEKYTFLHQVTITPKGKNQTHNSLYASFNKELHKYKCVKAVFLIAEFENTNHFHGYVYTKDKCKFLNMFKNTHPFQFHLSKMPDLDWCKYILKHNSVQYPTEPYNAP